MANDSGSFTRREYHSNSESVGRRYGRLVVQKLDDDDGRYAICKCDCGRSVRVRVGNLRDGNSRSCGCLRREQKSEYMKRLHADGSTPRNIGLREFGTHIGLIKSVKVGKRNTTGVKGVSFESALGLFRADLRLRGDNHYLGLFKTLEEAADARRAAEEKYYAPVISAWETACGKRAADEAGESGRAG